MNIFQKIAWKTFSKVFDVTEVLQEKTNPEILQIKRLYATIIQINQALTHIDDKETLFRDICKIAVEYGNFRMAWVGLLENTTTQVKPFAFAGHEEGYLTSVNIIVTDEEKGKGPTGRAVREKRCIFCQDIETDPYLIPWRKEALKRGYRSSASVPIFQNSKIIGVFNVYASEKMAFNNNELKLIDEIGQDISFALDMIERKKQQRIAAKALLASEERYRQTLENMLEGCQIISFDWRYLYLNDAAARHYHRNKAELLGQSIFEAFPKSRSLSIYQSLLKCMNERESKQMVYKHVYADSSEAWFELSIQPVPEGIFILSFNITERIRAELALQKSTFEMQMLFKNMLNAFIIWESVFDENGKYISFRFGYFNDAYAKIGKVKQEDVLGRDVFEVWPNTEHYWVDVYGNVALSGEAKTFELYHEPTQGWYHCNAYRPSNSPERVCVIFEDITERKMAEEALRESEEKFRTIFEHSPIGISMTKVDGTLSANKEFCDILGYSEKEFNEKKWADITHPDDIEKTSVFINSLIAGEASHSRIEKRYIHKNGNIVWTDVSSFLQRDKKNNPQYFITTIIDISERKYIEETLRESETHFRTLADSGQALIWTSGIDKKCNYFNQPWLNFTGHTLEQELGNGWAEGLHPDDKQKCIEMYIEAFNHQKKFDMEYRIRHTSGEYRWIQDLGSPRYDSKNIFIGYIGYCMDITDRKIAEERLRESEDKFRAIFENNSSAIAIIEPDTTISMVNDAYCQMGGYARQEVVGTSWTQQIVAEDIERLKDYNRQRLTSPKDAPNNYEFKFYKKNKEIRNAYIYVSLMESSRQIITSFHDITERKKNEDLISKHLELVKYATSHNLEDILIKTLDCVGELTNSPIGFYHFVNDDEKTVSLQTWSTQTIQEFCKAEGDELHYSIEKAGVWVDCIHERKPVIHNDYASLPHRKGLPKGHAPILREMVVPIFRAGKIVALLGVGNKPTDYTESDVKLVEYFADAAWEIVERKQAEERIQKFNIELEQHIAEATAELRDLYNNAPCGYHSLNKEGLFELINDTELRWLGYNREEVINKLNFTDVITDASKETFHENYPNFMKYGFINDLEFDMIRKDGSILPIILNATAIKDKEGNFLRSRSTMIDHTERKRDEESLREAHKRLEIANKELEAFSYSVSHDLRAPLRGIIGFTNILNEDYENILDDEGKRICNIIRSNAEKMGELIDDLLAFSRLSRSDIYYAKIDMRDLINSVFLELTSPVEQEQIKFIVNSITPSVGDIKMIKQVWINLISNAIKYSSHQKQPQIEIGSIEEELENIYYIKDNGVGFDMQYADKLFGVFQRLHKVKDFEGTGVGLAIVQRVIQRHGGRVWAESEPEKGATFYITLPKSKNYE